MTLNEISVLLHLNPACPLAIVFHETKLSYYKGSWNIRIFYPGFALKACKLSLWLPFIHLSNLYKPYLSFLKVKQWHTQQG